MLCPRCQQPSDPGAAYCGNCGFQLVSGETPSQNPPAASQADINTLPPTRNSSGKAITSFVLAVVSIPACLVPVLGLILSVLAFVFGTLSVHSVRRRFALAGMTIAVVATLGSLYLWVHTAEELVRQHDVTHPPDSAAPLAGLQTIVTPCYTTKIPATMTVTHSTGSCTFLGSAAGGLEQEEVKVMQVPGLTLANLATAAKSDSVNVVHATPGGVITKQQSATFAHSQAYEIEIKSSDGSAGKLSYVYDATAQGNLVIVLHTHSNSNGKDYDLKQIESHWSWL